MSQNLRLNKPLSDKHHPVEVYLNGRRSDNTRRTMRRHLDNIAQILLDDQDATAHMVNWGAVRYAHTAHVRATLMAYKNEEGEQKYQPSTINGMLSALRGVLKEAWLLEQMTAEDYHRAKIIENLKDDQDKMTGQRVAFAEIQAMADVCFRDKSDAGARDSAIIGLIATCGLRRNEVVQLTLSDVNTETGEVVIQSGAAKSNKKRTTWLRGGALLAMEDWLFVRDASLKTQTIFVPINKGGRQEDRELSDQTIYDIVKRRAKEAAVSDEYSPHDFRRTMITNMLETQTDTLTVQDIAGHASTDTTKRYDMRDEKRKRTASEKLHYPHRSRR